MSCNFPLAAFQRYPGAKPEFSKRVSIPPGGRAIQLLVVSV